MQSYMPRQKPEAFLILQEGKIMSRNEIINDLQRQKTDLERIIKESERRMKTAPEGSVYTMKHGKKYQFYVREKPSDRKGTYLHPSEHKKAVALIQKKYDRQVIAEAQKQLKVINRFLDGYEPDILKEVYRSQSEIRRANIIPAEIPDEEYAAAWQAVEYEHKSFAEDMPEHFTNRGERVRSKSEVLIANMLDQAGIPYRYECPVVLSGITFFPDFTALRTSDRQIYYWEHLGMMDDPEYCCDNLQKIRIYERNGIIPGVNLICTMETIQMPLNVTVINRMIEAYFM